MEKLEIHNEIHYTMYTCDEFEKNENLEYNSQGRIQGWWTGAKVEAPRGMGFDEWVSPSPTGEGSGEGAVPLPRKFLEFLSRNGTFSVRNKGGSDPPKKYEGPMQSCNM